jgi:hypothetical protein
MTVCDIVYCKNDAYPPFHKCKEHCKYKSSTTSLKDIHALISEYNKVCLSYMSNPPDVMSEILKEKKLYDEIDVPEYTVQKRGTMNYKNNPIDVYVPWGCETLTETQFDEYLHPIQMWLFDTKTPFPMTKFREIEDIYNKHTETIEKVTQCLNLRKEVQSYFIDMTDPLFKYLPKDVQRNVANHLQRINIVQEHLNACEESKKSIHILYEKYQNAMKIYRNLIESKVREEYLKKEEKERLARALEKRKQKEEEMMKEKQEQERKKQLLEEQKKHMIQTKKEKKKKKQTTNHEDISIIEHLSKEHDKMEQDELLYLRSKACLEQYDMYDELIELFTIIPEYMYLLSSPHVKKIYIQSDMIKAIIQKDLSNPRSITTINADEKSFYDAMGTAERPSLKQLFFNEYNRISEQIAKNVRTHFMETSTNIFLKRSVRVLPKGKESEFYRTELYALLNKKYPYCIDALSDYIKKLKEDITLHDKTNPIGMSVYSFFDNRYQTLYKQYVNLNQGKTFKTTEFISFTTSLTVTFIFMATLYHFRPELNYLDTYFEKESYLIRDFEYIFLQYEGILLS